MKKIDDLTQITKKVIKKYEKNIIFVSYAMGYGGNAVRRIISASPAIYYDGAPVKYPDDTEGFLVNNWTDAGINFDKYFKKQHLAACHDDYYYYLPPNADHFNIIKFKKFCSDLEKNRKVCLVTHNTKNIHNLFNCEMIRLVGRGKRAKFLFKFLTQPVEKIFKNNVHNLDVDMLFSKNYNEFENEYLKLCFKLNISPQINSVRAFILLWSEKQERYRKLMNEQN